MSSRILRVSRTRQPRDRHPGNGADSQKVPQLGIPRCWERLQMLGSRAQTRFGRWFGRRAFAVREPLATGGAGSELGLRSWAAVLICGTAHKIR